MKRTHLFAMIFASIVLASGCGPSTTDVKGVVKLDGKPVKGATVTFVSDDGKRSYSGFTDGDGNFTLVSGNNKSGVASGTYKVTVVKGPEVPTSLDPGSPDAMKAMQQGSKAGANADSKRKGPGGILMPPAPSGGGGGGIKSELPAIYATAKSTPISIKIPPDTQPISIDLKSAP